jgi:hypothetical protein
MTFVRRFLGIREAGGQGGLQSNTAVSQSLVRYPTSNRGRKLWRLFIYASICSHARGLDLRLDPW